MLARTIGVGCVLVCITWIAVPRAARALDSVFQLDDTSFVHQSSPGAEGVYPVFGQIDFVFGKPQDGTIPVSIPAGGLRLQWLVAEGMPVVELRIETDPSDMTLSIQVVAARNFSLSGKGLEALNNVFQGITERIGAEIDRARTMELEKQLSNTLRSVKECIDGRS